MKFITFGIWSYRYGFNGKENDNEVKGEGGQQDYGMRIYDPRLGRFLSVDPITQQYPELTPYQFASNGPIDAIDLDGLERMGYLSKFEYDGTWRDVFSAMDNGVLNVANTIPDVWNSIIDTKESIERGTIIRDTRNDFRRMGEGLQAAKKYLKEASFTDLATNPRILEIGVTIYLTGKVPLPGASSPKGNLLKQTVSKAENGLKGGSRDLNPTGGNMNCANCTVAGDLTLKGFPATATNILQNPLSGVSTIDFFGMWGKELSGITRHTTPNSIIKSMSNMKDGAMGLVFGFRGAGKTGHYFNVFKSNGVIKFMDFQKGAVHGLNPNTIMKDFKFTELWFKNTTDITPSAVLPK